MRKLFFVLVVLSIVTFVGCDKEESNPVKTQTPTSTVVKTSTPVPSPTETPGPTATPAEGVNVALNKEIEVSSFTENTRRGWYPNCVNDGEIEAVDGVHMGWTSQVGKYVGDFKEEDVNEWVIIDLGKEYTITQVKAWPRQDDAQTGLYFPVDYQLDISNDKTTWTKVHEKKSDTCAEDGDSEPRIIELENVKGRYVRFMGTKLTSINSTNPGDGLLMQLAELEIFSKD